MIFYLLEVLYQTEFDYKPVCSQLVTTYYVPAYKIIHVYFSHITYLMSHLTSLNNICEWSYKLLHSGCSKLTTNRFVTKPCPKITLIENSNSNKIAYNFICISMLVNVRTLWIIERNSTSLRILLTFNFICYAWVSKFMFESNGSTKRNYPINLV